jgi:hypothetical protein
MISPMALQRPPTPGRGSPPTGARKTRWPRTASVSVLRLGLLIGGLVIITDLSATAIIERSVSADDVAAVSDIDEILNYVLFSLLGVLVVRDTSVMLSGAVAGVFASLLDAIVVTAASLMVPPPPSLDALEFGFARNLVIGTLFAGLSGVVYAVVQRWSAGQRPRR